jgi:hypothetical protein
MKPEVVESAINIGFIIAPSSVGAVAVIAPAVSERK